MSNIIATGSPFAPRGRPSPESPNDRRDRVPVEPPKLSPPAAVSEHWGPDRFETPPPFDPMKLPPPGRNGLPDHDGSGHPEETPRWKGPFQGALSWISVRA